MKTQKRVPPKIEERSSTKLVVEDAFLMLEEATPAVDFGPSGPALF